MRGTSDHDRLPRADWPVILLGWIKSVRTSPTPTRHHPWTGCRPEKSRTYPRLRESLPRSAPWWPTLCSGGSSETRDGRRQRQVADPRLSTVEKLAEALGVKVRDLL